MRESFREAPEEAAGPRLATLDGVGTDLFQCDLKGRNSPQRKGDLRTSVGQTLGEIDVKNTPPYGWSINLIRASLLCPLCSAQTYLPDFLFCTSFTVFDLTSVYIKFSLQNVSAPSFSL